MKTSRSNTFAWYGFIALMISLLGLSFAPRSSSTESPLDVETYQDLMAQQVVDLDDLDAWYRETRSFYEIITPPDFTLRQSAQAVLPFAWKNFPVLLACADGVRPV